MGIGYAAEERLLTLNDRVDWFFPWYVPAPRDPRAAAMRVRDLMAMSSGLKSDPFDAMMTAPAGEQVRRFYETPMDVEPGIFFRYMSGNTAMHNSITTNGISIHAGIKCSNMIFCVFVCYISWSPRVLGP